MEVRLFTRPSRLLQLAPTPEVAGVIISNTNILETRAPDQDLPATALHYVEAEVRRGWVRAELARHAAASTNDLDLLVDLLRDKRVTVRHQAALRCDQLGCTELLAELAPDWEPPPEPRSYSWSPAPPPARPPDVELDLGPVRLTDDELFGRLRRYDNGHAIAVWLASHSDDLNGFRPAVAEKLLGRFPKNQQRISCALRRLPVEYFDRIAQWLGAWAEMAGPTVQDWHAHRLAERLGPDAMAWDLTLRLAHSWPGSAEELVDTAIATLQ